MGKFLKFVEDGPQVPLAEVNIDTINLNDPTTLNTINALLSNQTADPFITPYMGLGRIMNILSIYSIFLPKMSLDGESGAEYAEITQFGPDAKDSDDSSFYFYLEYAINDEGYYDIWSQIVGADDLDSLMNDDINDYDDVEDSGDAETNDLVVSPDKGLGAGTY